jgi:hypothetical protein
MGYSRPKITDDHIAEIKQMIQENPDWHRSRLSVELCKRWDWRTPAGVWKDVSCRDLLRDLDKTGLIALPPARHVTRIAGSGPERIERIAHCTNPVETDLRSLKPLRIEIAQTKHDIKLFKSYIAQYHYLGYDRSIGENMKYIIRSNGGIPLACIMFGSAAWKCRPRDEYIGWDDAHRRNSLPLVANNVRFLIFPWVRVPHLASHVLAIVARRLPGDWQVKYGHHIYLLETFVERDRFRGVCYKAANWVNVGMTTGRGRNSVTVRPTLPIKDVWLCPTCANFRDKM